MNIVKKLFGWVPGINDALKYVDKDEKKIISNLFQDLSDKLIDNC